MDLPPVINPDDSNKPFNPDQPGDSEKPENPNKPGYTENSGEKPSEPSL